MLVCKQSTDDGVNWSTNTSISTDLRAQPYVIGIWTAPDHDVFFGGVRICKSSSPYTNLNDINLPQKSNLKTGRVSSEYLRKHKTPVTSLSTVAYTRLVNTIKAEIGAAEKIGHAVMYGPGRVHSEYSGVYFYLVHNLQTLTRLFGDNIARVRVTGSEQNVLTTLEYENGFIATMVFIEAYYGFLLNIETEKGMLTYDLYQKEENSIFHRDLVKMFHTGEEPREHQSILDEVSILEAIAKSLESQEWEDVVKVTI
ncbi:MAG: hypothetical protein PF450_04095 [Bacteroidales bacterium]|nr:hypothetical protein [Bacteroidales bacterium]